jgi:hypothetical protein
MTRKKMFIIDDWPIEHIDWLKNNYNKGSFTVLEQEFNLAFPDSPRTRNSLIGKANRLGLRRPVKEPSVERKKKCSPFAPKLYAQRKPYASKLPPCDDALRAIPDKIISNHDCAWPSETGQCKFKACIGPYCENHAKLAYREMPSKARIRKLVYE